MNIFINHAVLYNSSDNIKYLFNYGFIIMMSYVYQIVSGLIISFYYLITANGYVSLVLIVNNIYYGYLLRYYHNNGANLVIFMVFIHIYRTLYYNRRFINNIYLTGYLILYILIIILFLGYILSWGQISFWGATVITSLLSFIPYLTKWLMGNYIIVVDTIKRFYILHYLISLISIVLILLHIYILHYYRSRNIMVEFINTFVSLWLYIMIKDFWLFLVVLIVWKIQIYIIFMVLSHTDNLIEVNILVTPLHIIPEWYFLSLYIILKVIPSQLSGLIFIVISINILLIIENLYIIITSYLFSYKIIINSIFCYYLIAIWLGCNLPTVLYITYGRYCLLLYIGLLVAMTLTKYKNVNKSF